MEVETQSVKYTLHINMSKIIAHGIFTKNYFAVISQKKKKKKKKKLKLKKYISGKIHLYYMTLYNFGLVR